jgi:hypothetical protein
LNVPLELNDSTKERFVFGLKKLSVLLKKFFFVLLLLSFFFLCGLNLSKRLSCDSVEDDWFQPSSIGLQFNKKILLNLHVDDERLGKLLSNLKEVSDLKFLCVKVISY